MTRFGLIFWQRNAMLVLTLVSPWLNPFATSPSTAVIPLLLSWMMAACAMLALSEDACSPSQISRAEQITGWIWLVALVALLCSVPPVIDHALTFGLIAALVAIGLMVAVGRRIAQPGSGLWTYLALAWWMAAVINSALGILQYLDLAHALAPWVNQPFKGDAFGNLRQRNQFASLTSIGWVALWCLVAKGQDTWMKKPICRWAAGLSLALLCAAAACSMSRTGALQWMLLPGLSLLWLNRQRKAGQQMSAHLWRLSVAAPLGVLLASVLMPVLALWVTGEWGASLVLRVAGQAQSYAMCASRHVLWSNALDMIAQHPWLGWGWAETDFAHFMTRYPGERFCDMLDNAHDLPLHLALELGIPFSALTVLAITAWVLRRRPWQELDVERLLAWGVLVVLAVHSLLEYPLWYGPFQLALGVCVGLLWQRPSPTAIQTSTPRPANLAMGMACLLFLACLYAAWDFNRVGQIYRAPEVRDLAYRDDPLRHAKASWLFKNQADFAELTMQTVTPDNAQQVYDLASALMHYSPEERVVQRLIDSAQLLGKTEQAEQLRQRLQAVQDSMKRGKP